MDEADPREDELQRFEGGQDIRDRASAFASRMVRFCDLLQRNGGGGRIMVPQLVNCATSIVGMLEEARAAESRSDFVSKCCISLKGCREAYGRLRIVETCRIEPLDEARALCVEAGELVAIISAIVRNTQRNRGLAAPRWTSSRIPNS
jgi:four helix bundle protein